MLYFPSTPARIRLEKEMLAQYQVGRLGIGATM